MPEPRRVIMPVRGASNATAFHDTPGAYNPVERLSNFEVFNADSDRPQVGSRAGFRRKFGRRFGDQPGQAAVVANRATVVTASNCRDIGAGVSKVADLLVGNLWYLDPVPSMAFAGYVDITADGGPAAAYVDAVAWSRDGASFAGVSNWGTAGSEKWRVTCYNLDGSVRFTWAGVGWVNSICFTDRALYILGGDSSFAPKLYKVRLSDGVLSAQVLAWMAWCGELVRARFHQAGDGTQSLFVAGYGNPASGGAFVGLGPVLPGSPQLIQDGIFAAHFRSGVFKLRIDASGASDETLTQVQYGTPLPDSHPYTEGVDGYFRPSQRSVAAPHGCYITDMAVGPDGSVLCTRTNQGWGWSDAYRPTGITRPYISAFLIDPDGNMAWEADTASIRGDGSGSGSYPGNPHFNDINDPTLRAAVIDSRGDCYVAGRANDGGNSVFQLAGDDGSPLWGSALVGTGQRVHDHAIDIDPTDQQLVVVGDRNNTWPGAGGAQAHWWKLSTLTGAVQTSYDIAEAVAGLAIAASPSGEFVYGTEKVT